jgi:hypothetical protein
MDTKYFQQALEEFREKWGNMEIGHLTLSKLSQILQRAQQIKAAHQEEIGKEPNVVNSGRQ